MNWPDPPLGLVLAILCGVAAGAIIIGLKAALHRARKERRRMSDVEAFKASMAKHQASTPTPGDSTTP